MYYHGSYFFLLFCFFHILSMMNYPLQVMENNPKAKFNKRVCFVEMRKKHNKLFSFGQSKTLITI